MDQDTQFCRVTIESLTPGVDTIRGVFEFSGMTLTNEGHEFRFRGTEPVEVLR